MYFATFLLKNLVRRKARSLLTILGIAVAIGTVVTLRGVSYGFERSFRANFERRGIDLVVVAAGIPDQLRSNLDEEIGPRIARIEGVRRVSSGLLELVNIERGESHSVISVLVNGWRPGGAQFDDLTIVSGRAIRPEDNRAIMLGATLAEHLKKGVGDTVTMQDERYDVVGIYRSFDLFENGGAVVPLATLQSEMVRPRSVTGFTVELEPARDKEALAEAVGRQIDALADAKGKPCGITAQPTRTYVSGTVYIRLANGMAWITSGIALIVGGITILNTMITAVMERTKEIGILQALGWVRARVLGMVLGEAVLLSLTGAAVGIATAMLVIRWLAGVPQTSGFVSGAVSPVVISEGLGLTFLMALIGGLAPAYRAAALQPTEAIRHE
jgi:putative ABC transport system permease protein